MMWHEAQRRQKYVIKVESASLQLRKKRCMNMNESYPGSKSYLLFHTCSPASFCNLNRVFKSCSAVKIFTHHLSEKRSENCVFLVRLFLKMEPWLKSTRHVPRLYAKLSSLLKEHLKVKYGGWGWGWSESKKWENIMHMRQKMKFIWMTGQATSSPIDYTLSKWKILSVWEAH